MSDTEQEESRPSCTGDGSCLLLTDAGYVPPSGGCKHCCVGKHCPACDLAVPQVLLDGHDGICAECAVFEAETDDLRRDYEELKARFSALEDKVDLLGGFLAKNPKLLKQLVQVTEEEVPLPKVGKKRTRAGKGVVKPTQ